MNVGVGARLLAVVVLLAIWLLTLGSLAPGDIALGLVLAGLVETGWRVRARRGGAVGSGVSAATSLPLHRSLLGLPRLLGRILLDSARGTWEVSKYSLGLRPLEHDGLVEIELEGISQEGVTLWAFVSTISPGEVVVDMDEERGVLVIHALDVSDPDAIRARHHDVYERIQKKVVP